MLRAIRTVVVAAAALTLLVLVTGVANAKPSRFSYTVNPANFVTKVTNPWFPLKAGTTFITKGAEGGRPIVDTFLVSHKTKRILGVTATVISDILRVNGNAVEKTSDWYAQDKFGNVWYFGEATETLDGNGHVLSRDGSWQAGVNGAQAGLFMPAHPRVGQSFRQEYLVGQAQDMFKVLSLTATAKVPYGSYTNVLRTREWSPLEPGLLSDKFYAKGVGMVSERDIKGSSDWAKLTKIIKP